MEMLEKFTLGIALLLILFAGFCECGEVSLKAFLILGVFDLFLLFQVVQKVDQLQQEAEAKQQHDLDDKY